MYAAQLVARLEFFTAKPQDISNFQWLFSRANPARLPDWFADLIDLIKRRAINAPRRQTFFEQPYLVEQMGKAVTTVRLALRLLEKLGVITTHRDRQNRHSIVASFFDPPPAPAATIDPADPPPEPGPPRTLLKKVVDEVVANPPGTNKDEEIMKSYIISSHAREADDRNLSPEDQAIINTFQQATGTNFDPARDTATLKALRAQFPQAIILAGILLGAMRLKMARPGARINSLAYLRAPIAEISSSNIINNALYLRYLMERARKLLMLEKR